MAICKRVSKLSAEDKKAIIGTLVDTSGVFSPTPEIKIFKTEGYRRKHKRPTNDKITVHIERDSLYKGEIGVRTHDSRR